jgi:uncharacterized protein with PIN domain
LLPDVEAPDFTLACYRCPLPIKACVGLIEARIHVVEACVDLIEARVHALLHELELPGDARTLLVKARVYALLDALLSRLGIQVVPMSLTAAEFAGEAYSRYGKGVGSPGVLNYGDVLSCGVARAEDEPLLFRGEDFPRTDISLAGQIA